MGVVWFGTRNKMQWVQAPAVSLDASKFDWAVQTNFISGGANVRRSVASHKEYQMAWDMTSRALVRVITDYADGIYGPAPVYWIDPFAQDANLLPAYWAAPFMGAYDGINLAGTTTAPTLISTPSNANGYPVQSAVYTTDATPEPYVWIPIPTGYSLWVGVHGVAAAGAAGVVIATPTTGATTTGTAVNLTMQTVTDANRVTQEFQSASGYDGVLLSLGNRVNLATNPSMESGTANPSNVSGSTGGTAAGSVPTGGAAFGTRYGRATWSVASTVTTNTTDVVTNLGIAGTVPATAGLPYSGSVYVRSSVAQVVHAQIQWLNSGAGSAGSQNGSDVTLVPNTWTRLSVVNAVATPTAVGFRVDVDLGTGAIVFPIGATFDWDAVLIEQSATLSNYFDSTNPLSIGITLSGIIVQVFPTGTTPPIGGFISGQGNAGCSFAAQPTLTNYNAAMDLVGLTAKLVETQAWV